MIQQRADANKRFQLAPVRRLKEQGYGQPLGFHPWSAVMRRLALFFLSCGVSSGGSRSDRRDLQLPSPESDRCPLRDRQCSA